MSPTDPEAATLVHILDAQRAGVLAIIAGLDDEALNATILPSGWTPLGLIEHLGDAERFWFQEVAGETATDPLWLEDMNGDEGWSPAHRRSPQTVIAHSKTNAGTPTTYSPRLCCQHRRVGSTTSNSMTTSPTCVGSPCTRSRRPPGMPTTSTSSANSSMGDPAAGP